MILGHLPRDSTVYRLLAIALLTACFERGRDDDDDDEDALDTAEDEFEWEPCETVHIDYIGEDEPVVGDEWIVWLYCDDALLMGPQLIRFDPTNFANIADDNVITFKRTGTGTMFMQVGAQKAEMQITVADDR